MSVELLGITDNDIMFVHDLFWLIKRILNVSHVHCMLDVVSLCYRADWGHSVSVKQQ